MKTETFIKTAPLALAAITAHMVEHQLPAPMSIDVINYADEQVIRLRVSTVDAQVAWVNSLIVDHEVNDSLSHPSLGFRTAWTVRLPDSGFVFELVGFRAQPFLSAVSA